MQSIHPILAKAFFALIFIFLSGQSNASERFALLIGNSKYTHLGVLENTPNDARDVEKSLKEIGFKTRLVLDADELTMRRAVKSFAADSTNASIAVIFYAGHGAQINGENYLLPVDLEVPKRESDIQLSGVRVDDVVNTVKSKTKVVFLDACRDNPSLTKSLSKGRGSYRGGLAATKSSSTDDGSNLFIAYATDSGNIALDGIGQKNSPFTKALLKYIKQSVSIDDMFSLVTREVRLATKNAQKPYKYASLEGVVCLTGKCGSIDRSESLQTSEVYQTTEEVDFKIASQSNDLILIKNFIEKYPNNPNTEELGLRLAQSSWGWGDIWILQDLMVATKTPVYLKPSSIKAIGDRRSFEVKWIFEGRDQLATVSKDYFFHTYSYVIDCKQKAGALFQTRAFNKKLELIHDSQTGDPRFIKLDINLGAVEQGPNSLLSLICNPIGLSPLVGKAELNADVWERLFTYEDLADYFFKADSLKKRGNKREFLVKIKFRNPKKISETRLVGNKLWMQVSEGFSNVPVVKTIVIQNLFDCSNEAYTVLRQRYFDEFDTYVGVENLPYSDSESGFVKVGESGGLRDLHNRLCN